MRLQILDKYPKAKFHLFAVWENALATDSRGAWSSYMFGDDSRVTSLWDGDNLIGQWFAQNGYEFGAYGLSFLYDAYFAYDKNATWKDAPTSTPVVDGSEIISHVDGLQQKFVPLLGVT